MPKVAVKIKTSVAPPSKEKPTKPAIIKTKATTPEAAIDEFDYGAVYY